MSKTLTQEVCDTGCLTENILLNTRFPGTTNHVRDAVCDLKRGMDARSLPEDVCTRAEIVTAEVLNNIVEHAYCGTPGGPITLCASLCDTGICITVEDRGVPMPGNALPKGRLPASDGPRETLPEGGFGWFLLHKLTHSLYYDRVGGKNVTRLIVALS